jgi:Uracil DNA glycosylase superfamily
LAEPGARLQASLVVPSPKLALWPHNQRETPMCAAKPHRADPLDGGIEARVLFLFEKPGPMTTGAGNGQRSGSGFISRDNDDPTAEAVFNFMRQADIPRELTILWNVIPWWNGSRPVERLELQDGARRVVELIHLLRNPRAVVLVGNKAAEARSYLPITGLTVFTSSHPSPLVRARWPERWKKIPSEWRKVKQAL